MSKNAFSERLTTALVRAFAYVRENSRCRALIVTGFDSYFCSGGTQEALLNISQGLARFTDASLYSLAIECDVPVIAAMQGHAIGGGFVFGLFADFVVLSRESVYTANFMKYGFTPGMGATCVMPRKLGLLLAEEMLLTARSYRGSDLERRGVSMPVLPRADVLAYARKLACDLAARPRISLTTLKQHLVREIKESLPAIIEAELRMHEETIHNPTVRQLILSEYNQ